jgi:SAM-dependent methyltransferase
METGNFVCSVCGGPASLLDVMDLNKACLETPEKFSPRAGIPVYYALCSSCGFCFAPELSKWSLEEFEEKIYNSEYVTFDPAYVEDRPRYFATQLLASFNKLPSSFRHLDYGGGNGLLAKLLRKGNWDSTSYDPFVDRNISIEQLGKFQFITAFEVFEHVPDVQQLMAELRSLLAPDGFVLFSTVLSDGHLHPNQRMNWWYASPRNGHISLFSAISLKILARQSGYTFISQDEGTHFFFTKNSPWAAHLQRPKEER